MIQALQHTSEQIYIHTWASAHDTRVLCSSFLDRCPYGGTRRASAHITRIRCSSFLDRCPYMVAHDGPVPTCITRILCSSVACGPVSIWWHTTGQCPHYKNPSQLIFGLVSIWWHTTGQCPHYKNPSQLIFGLVSIWWHICTSAQMI